jgi:hypothetical protein
VLQTPSAFEVEEVFVYVAVRSNRTPAAGDPACNDVGFPVTNRNDSELMALPVAADSRVNQIGNVIGNTVFCFGARDSLGHTPFVARLSIHGVTATGRGECTQQYRDFPEPRVSIQECWMKLNDLPAGYIGGFVSTSTTATRVADDAAAAACTGGACGRGLESDPPGYRLPAISTARLWKVRPKP